MSEETEWRDRELKVTVKSPARRFPLLHKMDDTDYISLRGVLHGAESTLCPVLICPPHPIFGGTVAPSRRASRRWPVLCELLQGKGS